MSTGSRSFPWPGAPRMRSTNFSASSSLVGSMRRHLRGETPRLASKRAISFTLEDVADRPPPALDISTRLDQFRFSVFDPQVAPQEI
jgi:hypothetical protein